MKMFDGIRDMVADEDAFVCVLLDEVESLTAARQAAMSGTDPSDAIRVVNALLTQLDAIKRWVSVQLASSRSPYHCPGLAVG